LFGAATQLVPEQVHDCSVVHFAAMPDCRNHEVNTTQFKEYPVVTSSKAKASRPPLEWPNIACAGQRESVDRVEHPLANRTAQRITLFCGAREKEDAERGHNP
jgi:hypothetical protein